MAHRPNISIIIVTEVKSQCVNSIYIFQDKRLFISTFITSSSPRNSQTFRLPSPINPSHLIGNTRWTNMIVYHNAALRDKFLRHSIEASVVYNGKIIFFSHSIIYFIADNRLIIIGQRIFLRKSPCRLFLARVKFAILLLTNKMRIQYYNID